MSYLDDIKDEYVDEETQADAAQAAAYYKKAEKCINDGDCDEVLVQAGAEYIGVDPTTAQLVYECAKSNGKDTDTCAKAGVTIGAIAACTYFSAGQAALCGKIAPFVVNTIWPVLGPVVTGTIGFVGSFIGGVSGAIKEAAEAFGDLIGLGGDEDRATPEEIWRAWAKQFLVPTKKAIAFTILEGVKAISTAETSYINLVQNYGSVGSMQVIKNPYDFESVDSIRAKAIKKIGFHHLTLLSRHMYNNEKFVKDVYVIWKPKSVLSTSELSNLDYKIHRSKPVVQKDEMLLHMKTAYPQNKMSMSDLQHMATTGESVWNPVTYSLEIGETVRSEFVPPHPGSGITYGPDGVEYGYGNEATPGESLYETFNPGSKKKSYAELMDEYRRAKETLKTQEYTAFTKALEWRMDGLIESINGAVGEQVSLKMSAPKESEESSGSSWLLWTGLIGAGALAYVYRKKLFK